MKDLLRKVYEKIVKNIPNGDMTGEQLELRMEIEKVLKKDTPTVIIESPFWGQTKQENKENIEYARRALKDSLQRNEAPFASHLLYTQVLDDNEPFQRSQGIAAGQAWQEKATLIAVYVDRGISEGMQASIEKAYKKRIPVEVRSFNKK